MSTDPKRTNLRTTWQEHDIWYVIDRVEEAFWQQPWHVVEHVVALCKTKVKPAEGREKLLEAAKEKMRSLLPSPDQN